MLSPDGTQVATVVATVDLDDNTTRTQHLARRHPAHGRPDRQPARLVTRRNASRVRHPVGARTRSRPRCTSCPSTAPARCARCAPWTTVSATSLGHPTDAISRSRVAPATTATTPRTSAWQSPRKIERFLSRLNGQNWIFDRPQHVYVVAADGTGSTPQPDAGRVRVRLGGLDPGLELDRHQRSRPRDLGRGPRRGPPPRATRRRDSAADPPHRSVHRTGRLARR